LGVPDQWIEHGDQATQQTWSGLSPEQIAHKSLERHLAKGHPSVETSREPLVSAAPVLSPGPIAEKQPAAVS
jgi:hypothetical protein